MVKKDHFNAIMAGLISGIVALTTATLGISGTVIGSVISSILYQILSKYSEQKIDNAKFPNININQNNIPKVNEVSETNEVNIGGEIVYLLPLVVIALIEFVFVFSTFLYPLAKVFHILEYATDQNLFRVMGLGMILLSFYPFLKSNNVDKSTGFLVFFTGVIFLIRGFVDEELLISNVASFIFARFDFWIGLFLLFVLLVIIVKVVSAIFTSRGEDKKIISYARPRKKSVKYKNSTISKSKGNLSGGVSSNSSNKNLNFFGDKFDD